jgi:hypothetical protein
MLTSILPRGRQRRAIRSAESVRLADDLDTARGMIWGSLIGLSMLLTITGLFWWAVVRAS